MARKQKTDEPEQDDEIEKQGHLPDMEPVSIPEIEEAAVLYVKARNEGEGGEGRG